MFIVTLQKNETYFKAVTCAPRKMDGKLIDHLLERMTQFVPSGDVHNLKHLSISMKGYIPPTGGALNDEQRTDLLSKKSIVTIKNDGKSCFWYASVISLHKNHKQIAQITDGRGNIRNTLAMELCMRCCFSWDDKVATEDIHVVEMAINKEDHDQYQFCVSDADNLPHHGRRGCMIDRLMYKGIDAVNKEWLLYDNGHFFAITDIKQFLGVDVFCSNCFGCFPKAEQAEGHDCTCSGGCNAGVITRRTNNRPFKILRIERTI